MANEIEEKKSDKGTEDEIDEGESDRRNLAKEIETKEETATETKSHGRKYLTKHMKLYPELYRSDVSIHPSYTTLKNLPYYVVCRRRVHRTKKQIKRQLNREIMHFAMMQMFAIDSVRIDRVFSVGIPPKTLIVPDLLTVNERRHINNLLCYV
ncbi:hypothetical protein ANTQUA_LOCUS6000 [Anthophora quadrimaculata]